MSFKTSVKTLISYSILTRVVALLSNFVLAYYLGLSEYGKIVIYQAVWGIVSSLGHGGFYKLLFVSKAMAYSQLRAMNIVSLTLTIISILAWNYYDASFNLVASALFLISSVFYFRALPLFVEMERRSEFALSSKIRLSNQIIFSFLLLITSVSGVTLIYSFCSSLFISQLITYYHMRYKTHIGKFFNLSLDYKTKLDKGDIKDAAYNFFSSLGNTLITQGDKIIISNFLGTSTVAIYNLCNLVIVQSINMLGQAIYKPLLNLLREKNIAFKISWSWFLIALGAIFFIGFVLYSESDFLYKSFSPMTVQIAYCFTIVAIFKVMEWISAPVLDFNRMYNVRFISVLIQASIIIASLSVANSGNESVFLSMVIISQSVSGFLSYVFLKAHKLL